VLVVPGVAVTSNVIWTLCDKLPLVPVIVIVNDPGVASPSATKVICWLAPGTKVNGAAGEELTPSADPATVMFTDPVKPFVALTDKLNGRLLKP